MPDTIRSGEALEQDQRLTSNNDDYRIIMQSDGNLVLYNSEHTASENAIWSSNTCHKSGFIGSYHLTMQHDGNLVVYDTCNRQMWASDTYHKGSSPHRLVMQNDGNLVIYSDLSTGWAGWAAPTRNFDSPTLKQNLDKTLLGGPDGRRPPEISIRPPEKRNLDKTLVIYDADNDATWTPGTKR